MSQLLSKASSSIHYSRGAGKLTYFIFFLILAAATYCLYEIGVFYYGYYDLQYSMDAMTDVAPQLKLKEIRRRLWAKVRENNLPLREADLIVHKSDNDVFFSAEWTEVLYFEIWGKEYEIHTFDFHATSAADW